MSMIPPTDAELLQTCVSLIEVPSIDGNRAELREVIQRIRDFFQDVPVEIHESEHQGYPSLVIATTATKCPKILLHGHVDVVPGLPGQFKPRVDGDRLIGRGAVDMKGFVAVAMHALRDLALAPNPPNVGLMINTDEEIGGRSGAKQLVEEGWSAEQLLNGDGGYGDSVTFAQKGIIQLTVELKVEPGSRNAPWDGTGAAEQLASLLAHGLKTLCPDQDKLTAKENWGSTATVLSIQSECEDNLPPKKATASVRLYWADDHTGAEVIELAKKAFSPATVSGVVEGERVYLSQTDPDLLRLRDLWQQNLGQPIGMRADNGSSDAKWFVPLGIPILILRIPGGGAHTDNEWLEIPALRPLYKTLCHYITEKCGQETVAERATVVRS